MSRKRSREVVMLCSVRTGSTWVGESLRQHEHVTYGEELVQTVEHEARAAGRVASGPEIECRRREIVSRSFTRYYLWKLHQYQAAAYPDVFASIAADEGVPIVFLRRRNLLELFVSVKVCNARKVYTRRLGDRLAAVEPFRVDPDEFAGYARQEIAWWNDVRERFRSHEFFETTYEAVCDDYRRGVDAIFRFLRIEPNETRSTTLKMQTRPYEEQVANWQATRDAFRGTDLADYV